MRYVHKLYMVKILERPTAMSLKKVSSVVQQTLGYVAIFAAQVSGELDPVSMYGYFLNLVLRSRCELHIFVYASCVAYNVFCIWTGQLNALHVRRIFLAALSLSYNLLSDTGAEASAWAGVADDSLSETELARLQQWVLSITGWNIHLLSSDIDRIWASIFRGKSISLSTPPSC